MKQLRWSIADRGAVGSTVALLLGGTAAAGLLIGAILGLFGGLDLVGEPAEVAAAVTASYYDCPDGDPLGEVTRGDRVFITARDESGAWVQVRSPMAASTRAWMRASHVLPDSSIDEFPVLPCHVPVVAEVVAAVTTTIPETTTTTAAEETTTTTAPEETTTTSSTTTTTVAPDTTAPSISNAAAAPGQIWELDGGTFNITCAPPEPRESTISATVTDSGGVATVTASWSDPLGSHSQAMSVSGNTYSFTFGLYAPDTWPFDPLDHTVSITVTARDGSGNQSSTIVNVTIWSIGECFI